MGNICFSLKEIGWKLNLTTWCFFSSYWFIWRFLKTETTFWWLYHVELGHVATPVPYPKSYQATRVIRAEILFGDVCSIQQSNFVFLQGNAGYHGVSKIGRGRFSGRLSTKGAYQKRPCWNWDQHDAGKYGHYKPNGLRVHLQHRGGYLCGANRAGACNALTESALELLALRYARGQDHLVEMRKNKLMRGKQLLLLSVDG